MKLGERLEKIFAHAVALQQSGRLRNTIYGIGRLVFILNQDHTVLLRFRLRKVDRVEFDPPISFAANDYDSRQVEVEDGRICFIQESPGFTRVKKCLTPSTTSEDVKELFRGFRVDESVKPISFHSQMLTLVDESLSHIEFSCVDGEFKITQRNIYSGTVSEITPTASEGLGVQDDGMEDFNTIGLRTGDFLALFTFVDKLDFRFLPDGFICVDSRDTTMPMRGLISKCVYDELGGTE